MPDIRVIAAIGAAVTLFIGGLVWLIPAYLGIISGSGIPLAVGGLVYFFGLGWAMVHYAGHQTPGWGTLLSVAYLPCLALIAWTTVKEVGGRREGSDVAHRYVAATDSAEVEMRYAELVALERGPIILRHAALSVVLDELERTDEHDEMMPLVSLVGVLGYAVDRASETLQDLMEATERSDVTRDVHRAVRKALLKVDPYFPQFGPERDLELEEAKRLDWQLRDKALDLAIKHIDAEISQIAVGQRHLDRWNSEGEAGGVGGGKSISTRESLSTRESSMQGLWYRVRMNALPRGPIGMELQIGAYEFSEREGSLAFQFPLARDILAGFVMTADPKDSALEDQIIDIVRESARLAEANYRTETPFTDDELRWSESPMTR